MNDNNLIVFRGQRFPMKREFASFIAKTIKRHNDTEQHTSNNQRKQILIKSAYVQVSFVSKKSSNS